MEYVFVVNALTAMDDRIIRRRMWIILGYLAFWVILKISELETLNRVDKISVIVSSIVIMVLCYYASQQMAGRSQAWTSSLVAIVAIGMYHSCCATVFALYPEYRALWSAQSIFNVIERVCITYALIVNFSRNP